MCGRKFFAEENVGLWTFGLFSIFGNKVYDRIINVMRTLLFMLYKSILASLN